MSADYRSHVVHVLVKYYLENLKIVRYDTWLHLKGYGDEYVYMMMRSDAQVYEILLEAHTIAKSIKNSPLAKALTESEQ